MDNNGYIRSFQLIMFTTTNVVYGILTNKECQLDECIIAIPLLVKSSMCGYFWWQLLVSSHLSVYGP